MRTGGGRGAVLTLEEKDRSLFLLTCYLARRPGVLTDEQGAVLRALERYFARFPEALPLGLKR